MKKSILVFATLTLVYFGCADPKEKKLEEDFEEEVADAQEDILETEEVSWITLFDGEDMNAWRGYNSDVVHDNWSIEDDAVKFTPGEEGGKNIITKDKFENFVLSLEWKVSEGANSGVFWGVHEDKKYNEAYQTGPEIQVLDNDGHPDAKVANGTHTAGSLYDMIAMDPELVNEAGEWNQMELTVNHNTNEGKMVMNGAEAFTFPVHGPEWNQMIENSKFKDWEGFGTFREGHIGLQDHGDVVWFREIKIRRL